MGIRNVNEDYFTSPITSLFTNSSCGIFPTISANYPIANYPVASVGMHYCYEGNSIKAQASLYNGTGYNSFTSRENVFRVCPKDDGVFGITEVSYNHGGSSYFVGNALRYNGKICSTPWFYTEQNLSQKFALLICYSHAFSENIECNDFIGLGTHCLMGKYQLGAFTDYANFVGRDEFATEFTFKIPLAQHIDIQPTVHIITYDKSSHCITMLRISLLL